MYIYLVVLGHFKGSVIRYVLIAYICDRWLCIAQDFVEPSPADENEEEDAAVISAEASEESTGSAAAAPERKVNFQKVGVTEVSSCHTFFAQRVEDGKRKIIYILLDFELYAYLASKASETEQSMANTF